jgi:hypothetical protein
LSRIGQDPDGLNSGRASRADPRHRRSAREPRRAPHAPRRHRACAIPAVRRRLPPDRLESRSGRPPDDLDAILPIRSAIRVPPSLPAALALAALLLALAVIAGLGPDASAVMGLVAAAGVIALAGDRLTSALGYAGDTAAGGAAPAGVQVVAGLMLAALAVSAIVTLSDTSALTAFAIFAGCVLLAAATTRRGGPAPAQADWADGARLVVIGAAVLFWVRRTLAPADGADGTIAAWSDYVLHAVEIAQYEHGRAAGAMLMAGEPLVFYHRGTYALPAALAQWLDATPLQSSTAVLLPLGLFVAVVAAAALADRIGGGPLAGWASAAGAIALPDAAAVGLRNGFFGAHWLLFTSPGTGWAVGAALLSMLMLDRWLNGADRRALAAAVLACAATFWLRAHVFLLAAPTLVLLILWRAGQTRPAWGRAGLLALAAGAAGAAAVASIPALREPWLAFSAVDDYLPLVHGTMIPSAYEGLWATLAATLPWSAALLLGALLVLPACLGVLLPAYAVLLVMGARTARLRAIDAAPIAMAVTLVGLTLAAPGTAHGDLSEYQHRGFPLLYMLTLAVCAGLLVRMLAWVARLRHAAPARPVAGGPSRLWSGSAQAAAAALTCAAVVARGGTDPGANAMPWTSVYYPLRPDAGLVAAAGYLRAEARRDERLAVLPPEPDVVLNDAASLLVALSAVPAWIGRVEVQRRTADPHRRGTVEARAAGLRQIGASSDIGQLHQALRERGVRWLVFRGDAAPAWDPADELAAFRAPGVRVYRGEGAHR